MKTSFDLLKSLNENALPKIKKTRVLSEKENKLNEGAGAGYHITGTIDASTVNSFNVVETTEDKYGTPTYLLDCDISATLEDVTFESYYDGGHVDSAQIQITKLLLVDNHDPEEKGELNNDNIKQSLDETQVKSLIGGGWVHSTFDGNIEFKEENADGSVYSDFYVYGIEYHFIDEELVKFIDLAVQGENIIEEYIVYAEDYDELDRFDSEEEAIEYAKNTPNAMKVEQYSYRYEFDGDIDINSEYSETVWEKDDFEESEHIEESSMKEVRQKSAEKGLLEPEAVNESEDKISYQDLVIAGESLWRDDATIYETRVDGIWDCHTAGHGGYLVDVTKFPELAKYGEKTSIDNIVGFEEDYEALKVIWAVPEVLEKIQLDKDWYKNLTLDDVLKYDDKLNDEFRKEFPNKKEIAEVPEMKTESEELIEEEKVSDKLTEVKSQGNVYMLQDNDKYIVGEDYNKEENLIENAEIYENKEEADKDYFSRCDITRDGEQVDPTEQNLGVEESLKEESWNQKRSKQEREGRKQWIKTQIAELNEMSEDEFLKKFKNFNEVIKFIYDKTAPALSITSDYVKTQIMNEIKRQLKDEGYDEAFNKEEA